MEKSSPRHIIFATDFSARCDRAQDRAIQLAVQWQARLTAVHVIEDEDDFLEQPETKSVPRAVARNAMLLREELKGIDELISAVVVRRGRPLVEIKEIALWDKADLIVTEISRNETDGRSLLGSTTTSLLRESGLPVLVVKKKSVDTGDRIVVATDVSPAASAVLETTVRFFRPETLILFYAFDPPFKNWVENKEAYSHQFSKDIAQRARDTLDQSLMTGAACQVQVVTLEGDPARRLAEYVDDNDIDLVIAGTESRSTILNLFIDSVAGNILHEVQCDIMIVPSHAHL